MTSFRSHRVRAWSALLPAAAGTIIALSLAAFADEPRIFELPPLGNTAETDRQLLREIGDDHTVEPGASVPLASGASPPAAPIAASLGTANGGPTGLDAGANALPASARSLDLHDLPTGGASAERPPGPVAAVPDGVGVDVSDAVMPVAGAPSDVWARIRASDRLPPGKPEVLERYREQYLGEAHWVGRILARSEPFIKHLVEQLDARFLPVELALLPAVESGFRPEVRSTGKAAGLWQIVPITAKEIGLERNVWFDGRADIVASTTAAIDYLSYLNSEFHGDWELTLAAYNAGPGRVRGAIRKNEKAGKPTDFWSLSLPPETRAYVPKILALVQLVKRETPVFALPEIGKDSGFELVEVGLRISVDKAATLSGIPEKELRRLNAGLVHGVTAPDGPHALYLPRGHAEDFLEQLAKSSPAELFSLPATHVVVVGDTLSGIAKKFGVSQRRLMDMNGLETSRIRVGDSLAVMDSRHAADAEIEYVVTIGDTLSEIARRHSVRIDDIRGADGDALAGDMIHPGETLSIRVSLGDTG